MTVKEALDVLKVKCSATGYGYVLNSGIVKLDLSNNVLESYLDLDWSFIDIHTVENFHFIGRSLDLDSNESLKSLDGLIFDAGRIRAYRTGIDHKSLSYIRSLTRKV